MPAMTINGYITDVDTTQKYELGFEWEESANSLTSSYRGFGNRLWRYVLNDGAAAVSAGHLCQRKAGTTAGWTITKATNQSVGVVSRFQYPGVAQHEIGAGKYGFILVKGAGLYVADTGGTTVDLTLIAGNAVDGCFDTQALATVADFNHLGYAITAATATNTGIGYFNFP